MTRPTGANMDTMQEIFGDVIHAYTRADALADGVLVDISPWAQEAGFKYPVAVTEAVWDIIEPSEELQADGQDAVGRAWDLLTILHHGISRSADDEVHFAPLFVLKPASNAEPVAMYAKCGPGDDGEPVITIILASED